MSAVWIMVALECCDITLIFKFNCPAPEFMW